MKDSAISNTTSANAPNSVFIFFCLMFIWYGPSPHIYNITFDRRRCLSAPNAFQSSLGWLSVGPDMILGWLLAIWVNEIGIRPREVKRMLIPSSGLPVLPKLTPPSLAFAFSTGLLNYTHTLKVWSGPVPLILITSCEAVSCVFLWLQNSIFFL